MHNLDGEMFRSAMLKEANYDWDLNMLAGSHQPRYILSAINTLEPGTLLLSWSVRRFSDQVRNPCLSGGQILSRGPFSRFKRPTQSIVVQRVDKCPPVCRRGTLFAFIRAAAQEEM
jgi:hypothetical protein